MSTEERIVRIEDNFAEQGLTLEEAYILGRVRDKADYNNIYRETNEEIAKVMGKSKSAVKRWINSLVEKGYLRKEYSYKCRMLYPTDMKTRFKNWNEKEHIVGPHNDMNLDERVTYLKTALSQGKFEEDKVSHFNDLSLEEQKMLINEKLKRMKPRNEEDIY